MEERQTYIQAFISNLTYHRSFEELRASVIRREPDNLRSLLSSVTIEWAVPRWSHQDDVVLFVYSKSAGELIQKLRKRISPMPTARFHGYSLTNYGKYRKELDRAYEDYEKYGGKVVAIGRLLSDPDLLTCERYKTYATVGDIHILENPVPYAEFTKFLRLSQGGVTPVWGDWYEQIKEILKEYNNDDLPDYFIESRSMTVEESKINENNWLKENLKLNFNYKKEEEFRTFYVDYLLKELSDDGMLYTECPCYKEELRSPSFADYFISIGSRWLPVETKIDIGIEKDIDGQVSKYCELTEVILDPSTGERAALEDLIQTKVLIIDERRIQIYDHETGKRSDLSELREIKTIRNVLTLRESIIAECA